MHANMHFKMPKYALKHQTMHLKPKILTKLNKKMPSTLKILKFGNFKKWFEVLNALLSVFKIKAFLINTSVIK